MKKENKEFISFEEFMYLMDEQTAKNVFPEHKSIFQLLSDKTILAQISELLEVYGDVIKLVVYANIYKITQRIADPLSEDYLANPHEVQILRRDIKTLKKFLHQLYALKAEYERLEEDKEDDEDDKEETKD